RAGVDDLFVKPQHPYTWGLLGSLPLLDAEVDRLTQIPGGPPSLLNPPRGCRFHPRCPYVMNVCRTDEPPLTPDGEPGHLKACHLDGETRERESAKIVERTLAGT